MITIVDVRIEFRRLGITSIDLDNMEVTSILAKAIVGIIHKTYRDDNFFHDNENEQDSLGYCKYLNDDIMSIVDLHLKMVDVYVDEDDLIIITKSLLKIIQKVTGWSRDNEQYDVNFYKVINKKNLVIFNNVGSIYVAFWRELHGK